MITMRLHDVDKKKDNTNNNVVNKIMSCFMWMRTDSSYLHIIASSGERGVAYYYMVYGYAWTTLIPTLMHHDQPVSLQSANPGEPKPTALETIP